MSVPTGRDDALEVVQVAVPVGPDVTVVVPQPVLALHSTLPLTSSGFAPFLRPFTNPYWPLIVAVNVTDWLNAEGFRLEATVRAAVAELTTSPPLSEPPLPA